MRAVPRPTPVRRRIRARRWALMIVLAVAALWVLGELHPGNAAASRPVHEAALRPLWVRPPSTPLPNPPFAVQEASGVLWDLNDHRLLWAKAPHHPYPLASTTKLMTAYLVLHHLDPAQTVTISPKAAGTGGSAIDMRPGLTFTVRQLLYGLLMASANDAAVALAEADAGSTAAFVRAMNATAQQWGLTGTHFADPDGLSPNSRGTAWDLAVIAEQDMQSPLFRTIVATKVASLPDNPRVYNLNGLLFRDPSVIGLKTGWTNAAGFDVVFAATRTVGGHRVTLLGVLMRGRHGFPPVYRDAEALLNWGFAQLQAGTPGAGSAYGKEVTPKAPREG
ncbi:MAG: serine hydrolase [Firmicutes bacterium]|nr:D-alanyl-D-alanine carboxypeptidase [Alicyclobacillaceae bacterium]MCL6497642.1 serine hydrolase [Bacillota bacterium]